MSDELFAGLQSQIEQLKAGQAGSGVKPAGGTAIRRHRVVMEAHERALQQGWKMATIINLHPFQLDLNMGFLGHLTVPAKKQGEPYAKIVIDKFRMDTRDLGDGNVEPIPVFPVQLAQDLVNHYDETGGVFYFEGTGEPPASMMTAAMEKKIQWYFKLYAEAEANWAQFHKNPHHISVRMRDAAKELLAQGLIKVQPEWTIVSKSESPDNPCEGCGQVIPKIAKFCVHCNTIYDVDWVKARRPDLWAAQHRADLVPAVAGAYVPDVPELNVTQPQVTGKKEPKKA